MITFYFVRHGQKEAVPFDPPLSVVGKKQAELTGRYLENIDFKAIIASPKLRTRQTAEAIARFQSLPIITYGRLIERLEWENSETFDKFLAEWSKTDLDRNYVPQKGDSSVNKGKKMKAVIGELAERYSEGNILIVTHGGAIGDLLRNVFGEENIEHVIDPVTSAPHVLISECSVTVIENEEDKLALQKLNDTSHLSEPLT